MIVAMTPEDQKIWLEIDRRGGLYRPSLTERTQFRDYMTMREIERGKQQERERRRKIQIKGWGRS